MSVIVMENYRLKGDDLGSTAPYRLGGPGQVA